MTVNDHIDPAPDGDRADRLGRFWRLLAESEFSQFCPIYERIGLAIADDPELLARMVTITDERKVEPVLCLASMKYLVSAMPASPLAQIYDGSLDADPWPPFRDLLLERFDDVAELMRTRTIQTNETGRAAVVIPALADAVERTGHSSIALIEIGPSAGLNLQLDQFRIDYGPHGRCGPDDAAVRMTCEVIGPDVPPIPERCPRIASRVGLDISPLSVLDDDHVRWLEACIWPGLTDRIDRFRAAVEVARRHPPELRKGTAVDLLPAAIDESPADALVVIVSTWVLAYFTEDDRRRVEELLADAAVRLGRPIAAITGEYPGIVPWVDEAPRPAANDDPRGASLLGLRIWHPGSSEGEPLAWTHAHGRWIDWLT